MHTQFLQAAGIYEDFMSMITSVGLQTFMGDTRTQYSRLTKIFVEILNLIAKLTTPLMSLKFMIMHMLWAWKTFAGL